MGKKHYAGIAAALSVIIFLLIAIAVPFDVTGYLIFAFGTVFLAITVSITIAFVIVVVTRLDYVKRQVQTFRRFRYLLALMIKRDFVTRYRRSVLGVLWSLLNPLLTMLVLTLVFSFIFRWDIPNFPVYLISGQVIFNFFSESTTTAMGSIVGNAGIIKKVYVPKYIFPVSRVLSSLINLAFSFIAFLIVFIITGESFRWTILLIPIPILYVFVFSLGVGMMLSAVSVFFRDIGYLYSVLTTLLMFLTPIFYPVSMLSERMFHFVHFNPIFHFVNYFRALTLDGVVPGLWVNVICIGFALSALCGGLYATMAKQDKFILYL